MADPRRRSRGNVDGPWFVDDSCIDCDASRQCAPTIFEARDGGSVVIRQPVTPEEVESATRALLSCPSGSIGAQGVTLDVSVFPHQIAEGVFLTGFNSPRAFGGNAWLVQRPEGNVLVDGPRFTAHLVRAVTRLGGLSDIVLTHQDDVGDADQYAAEFGARVWIHEADARAAPFATELVRGAAPRLVRPGLELIPVPGHTRGSLMLLLEDTFLFTGDSLFWSRRLDTLHAFRRQCWYSWPAQRESLSTLAGRRFEWVLPGHGGRAHRPATVMQERLKDLLERMGEPRWVDSW